MSSADDKLTGEIIDIIAEVAEVPIEDVTPDKTLDEDLDIDSLTMAEASVAIQDRLGIELSEEDVKNLVTVQDVVDRIRRSTISA